MTTKNYGLVRDLDNLSALVDKIIESGDAFGFDIETGYDGPDRDGGSLHPDWPNCKIVGISFTNSLEWARYVPVGHDSGPNLDPVRVAEIFWRLLRTGKGVAHNAKFERRHLARFFRDHLPDDEEVQVARGYYEVFSDTMIEAYLVAEWQKVGLKPLTKALFGHDQAELISLFPGMKKGKSKALRFNSLDLTTEVVNYACEDALWALAIHRKLHPRVKDMFLYKVEMSILKVLCEMEDFGIKYDWAEMRRKLTEATAFLAAMDAEIQADLSEWAGKPVLINLGSPKQVGDMLYETLGLPIAMRTDTGAPSTGETALKKLADQYPVVKRILEWREVRTLITRYLGKYEDDYAYAPDGMVHANHMQTAVGSGRFAVSDSPYQQCLSGDVEVLTPEGWRRLDYLTQQHGHGAAIQVAQFVDRSPRSASRDQTGDGIEFVAGELVAYPYAGEMVEIRGASQLSGSHGRKGEGGTWRYTPDHRMFYRKIQSDGLGPLIETVAGDWEADLSSKRLTSQGRRLSGRRIPRGGHRIGGRVLTTEERHSLALAIACQADGNRRTDGAGGAVWFDVELYRPRKIAALTALVGSGKPQDRGSERWRISESGWLTPEKNFVSSEILALCEDDLRWFLERVLEWDGDFTRGATYGQVVARRASVDLVQAVGALCGLSTSIYERPEYGAVSVNFHDRMYRESGWQETERVPAPDGHVYCVTVPSGMILVRNAEGIVQVTGNTPKDYYYELLPAQAVTSAHREAHPEVDGKPCSCGEFEDQYPEGSRFFLNFRDLIVAPADHYILGYDYSQVELRVMAGESGEPSLMEAFNTGGDPHTTTASLMLNVAMANVSKAERAIGKTMNFALLYGMGVNSLAQRLGISKQKGQELYDKYFSAFSSIDTWTKRSKVKGVAAGHTISKFGRKFTIWELQSEKDWIRAKGERLCVNGPIQGGAADYMKISMVRAHQALKTAGLLDRVHLAMNIHDALEFTVHNSVKPEEVIRVLLPAVTFPVPGWPKIEADWHIGRRWGSLTELAVDADGHVTAKGKKAAPAPVDTEDGEPRDESDPDAALVRAALTKESYAPDNKEAAQEHDQAGQAVREQYYDKVKDDAEAAKALSRLLIVELAEMPLEEQFERFREMAFSREGSNSLLLKTPEGEVELPWTTGLSPNDRAEISMLFAGANVYWSPDSVDIDAVLTGIDL